MPQSHEGGKKHKENWKEGRKFCHRNTEGGEKLKGDVIMEKEEGFFGVSSTDFYIVPARKVHVDGVLVWVIS